MNRARRRNEARLLNGLEQTFTTVARPLPTTVLWRWRYELALAGLAAAALYVSPWLALPVGAMLAAGAAIPGVREHAWRVGTAHRVRTACAEARIHSRGGRLPAILRTSNTSYGQRVLLWCPAGVSAEDFRSARALLAAACWAIDVLVDVSPRHAHLVELRVVRRPETPAAAVLVARARRHSAAPAAAVSRSDA